MGMMKRWRGYDEVVEVVKAAKFRCAKSRSFLLLIGK